MTITLDLSPEVSENDVALSNSLDPAEAARRERSLALLGTLDQIGDEREQQETFAFLKTAVNADRLSDRDRF